MINNHIWGPEFNKKKDEIRKLKAELTRIDAEKTRPSFFTQTQTPTVPPPIFETYAPFYTPSRPQQPVYNQFFRFSHLQPSPQPKLSSPRKSKSKVKILEPKPKVTSSSTSSPVPPKDSPKATPEPPKKDKGPMESNPSSSSYSTNSVGTSTDSESEYADITSILMATKTEDPSTSTATPIVEDSSSDAENQAAPTEPEPSMPLPVPDHSTKPSSASWFTFDDIPRHKWPAQLQEFAAWIDLQETKPNAQPQAVLHEFMARSTGSLRDWLESLGEYKQSQQDDQIAFIIVESSDSEDISVISTVHTVDHVSAIPRPSLKMSVLPSKFHKPAPVIRFIDTGADTSMIDPSVLPSDCWEKHSKLFRAVNSEIFETTLITKKPIDTLRLYALSKTPSPYSHISQKFLEFCPENHSQFHHPSPLWKNEQFFIHLPFKLNEDINPTKASHSDWACQAFYVEKRSELVRGKKRLVIDYQPLNNFLKDDKFPLPKIQTLFVHLQGARIFSKFDLKAGFWHLGILPVDRPKTAFCIPDAHCQWTVMPFGLKVLTLSSLTICEDELWYMWCLTTLYATKLVFPVQPVLRHLTTPEFSPDLLWTLIEWYSPLTWSRKQLKNLCTFHGLDKMPEQEADMFTAVFIVHRPYFQHPETRDFWTQDMAYKWKTYPHPYTLIHDPSVTSIIKSYLMELNNVHPSATNIYHTSVGPSHTLEIIPKVQTCTPGSSSSPRGILVMEQRPDYTNVLFQDAQDPWENFRSLLHTKNSHYTITEPDPHAPSAPKEMTTADEEAYLQAKAYLDQRQIRRAKCHYEKATGDVSPSRYPSTS
ncbi:hypothetical protein KPL70_017299 [Citrus sinensis]|nr:hypothetical protein KPL70_017299 [Citrus sinensis]